ncbi:hypothetical protein [Flexivirga alba]|uniref:DUF3558 domain-containing protein n=1 Tax=Flexivirga alba TaxID=702742 RepID=A0ABW2ACR4_9MICO
MSLRKTASRFGVIVAMASLLAACGSSAATQQAAPTGSHSSPTSSADQPADVNPTTSQRRSAPSAHAAKIDITSAPDTAKMVCSDDIRANIGKLLHLSQAPLGHATWDGTLYTCRYDLAAGPLVLTVHQSPDNDAARSYLQDRKKAAGGRTITGLQSLGLPGFQDRAGTVAFAKDDFTLVVDASKLSGTLGNTDTNQTDFAYTVATDVLACWSHD